MPFEMITMLDSTVLGGVMSIWSQSIKAKQAEQKMLIQRAEVQQQGFKEAREYDNKGFMCKDGAKIHPTQKPIALFEYLIKTYSNEGDTILDPCMGSGTTGVASNNTNRKFIGIERDREYYNIALDRLSSLPVDITKL